MHLVYPLRFEDRERLFSAIDLLFGARMHVQIDSTNAAASSAIDWLTLIDMAANRFDGILDCILTRYNVCRMYGVIHVDLSMICASSCTGPLA